MTRFVGIRGGFKPRRKSPIGVFTSAGGAVAYTVTLSPAVYSVTASSLAATTGRLTTLSSASFAFTGSALASVFSHPVTLIPAAYTLTASSLTAVTARFAVLNAASYAVTAASLESVLSRKATLSPASYAYAGLDLTAVYAPGAGAVAYTAELSPAAFAFAGASLTATYTDNAVVTAPTTGTTGGGGTEHFYRGKYRHDLRRTILRAAGLLREVKTTRARKRRARQVAKEIVAQFHIEPIVLAVVQPIVPPEFLKIEGLRLQIFDLTLRLQEKQAADAANAARLEQLFAEYQVEANRLQQQEDEEAIMMILAVAA